MGVFALFSVTADSTRVVLKHNITKKPHKINNAECEICKEVAAQVSKNSDEISKTIANGFENFCDQYEPEYKNYCELAGKSLTQAIELVLMQTENICPLVGLCTEEIMMVISFRTKGGNNDQCKDCQAVAAKVYKFVADTVDKAFTKAVAACVLFPEEKQCKDGLKKVEEQVEE